MDGDIRPFEFMARREDWAEGISLYCRQVITGVGSSIAQPLTFKAYEPGTVITEPIIRISIQEAQNLMDELWRCGLRPTEGTGSAGAFAALQNHLKDMRALVFKEKIKKESQ